MGMTVRAAFVKLIVSLQPGDAETARADERVQTIRRVLASGFDVRRSFVVGSKKRRTFVAGQSDVDIFALLAKKEAHRGGTLKDSRTVLDNVRFRLEDRYYSTDIGRDGQAVVVRFSDGGVVDVVPAFYEGPGEKNWPVYLIPNGAGGWLRTSPEFHNKYIKDADGDARGKIRRTAQLMKFWRSCRANAVPISSFYIETVLASEGLCAGARTYSQCLGDLLRVLDGRKCRALQDPLKVSQYICAVATDRQRADAAASIARSRDHADRARIAEEDGDQDEARRQWGLVFNGKVRWLPT